MKTLEWFEKSAAVFCIISFAGTMLPVLLTGGGAQADPDAPGAVLWFVAVYAIVILLIAVRPRLILTLPWANPMCSLLIILVFASISWSLYPDVTLRRGIAFFFTTLFGLYMAMRFSFRETIKLLTISLTFLMFLSFVSVFAMPDIGVDHFMHEGAWKGIFFQKNVTGRMMVWLVLCLLWLDWMRQGPRWVARPLLALALLLMIMCQSGTGLVTSVVVAAALITTNIVRGDIRRFVPAIALLFALAVIGITGGAAFWTDLLAMLGRDPTLTGRTVLWEHVLHSAQEKFLLGYGYGAYWFGIYGPGSAFIEGWGIDSAHNGWIEICLDVGIFGVALVALMVLRTVVRGFLAARYGENRAEPAWIFAVGCALLLISISESVFLERHSLNWVVLVIGSTRLVQRSRWLRAQKHRPPTTAVFHDTPVTGQPVPDPRGFGQPAASSTWSTQQ